MSKSEDFGPLAFRLPIVSFDRQKLEEVHVVSGDRRQLRPAEALLIEGKLKKLVSPLMLRPIFPGAMRFLAEDPNTVPAFDAIKVDAKGKLTDETLQKYSLTGHLVVRLLDAKRQQGMRRDGTLAALGEAPGWSLYGPVRLTPDFFQGALLNLQGLARTYAERVDGKTVRFEPNDPRWAARAFRGFLAGTHEPTLRCGTTLEKDDAQLFPMPELVTLDDRFSLAIALGWLRQPDYIPTSALDPNVEIVPVVPFLRHVGKRLRETVLGQANEPLLDRIFEGEDTSEPWRERLQGQLQAMGFGSLDGKMPIEAILREFQIAASSEQVATAKAGVGVDQLARRDFRDLVATNNQAQYKGPISGRANQETRKCINDWGERRQRSPVLIPAFEWDETKTGIAPGEVATITDLWTRKETEDTALRMFAADFTRIAPGASLDESGLQPIGNYTIYEKKKTGGPVGLAPSAALRVDFAEFTPGRIGLAEEGLLVAANRGDPLYPAASTFRVIRAVAEIECLGYLDQINGYDDAGISFGPCHWAMGGLEKSATEKTELGGLAAYLRHLDVNGVSGVDVFAPQGLVPFLGTNDKIANAAQSTSNAANTWQLGLADDRGRSRQMQMSDVLETIPSWRNYYRWVAIGRQNEPIGPASWAMALRRLHHLLEVRFPEKKDRPSLTLGTVFTSELAVALLLRWHVKKPNTVVTTEERTKGKKRTYFVQAHPNIIAVYEAAKRTKPKDGNAWQVALIQALRTEGLKADATFEKDFREISERPWWKDGSRAYLMDPRLANLREKHDDFQLLDPDPGP